MKQRLNLYFDIATSKALDELAARRRISKSAIVEAAVTSFLSPDGADRMEAAFLQRLSRQVERLERGQTITLEAFNLFIRAWLTATPPLAGADQPTAQAKGRERYASFIEALARRYQQGRSLAREVVEDIELGPVAPRAGDSDGESNGASEA
jgi:predicted transcriptional regulator